MSKALRDFIRENRKEIDHAINCAMYRFDGNGGRGTIPQPEPGYNDHEREMWIRNDAGLYGWARAEGVRV